MTRLPSRYRAVAWVALLAACGPMPGRPTGADPATESEVVAGFDEPHGGLLGGDD